MLLAILDIRRWLESSSVRNNLGYKFHKELWLHQCSAGIYICKYITYTKIHWDSI